mmetsp:Transcript_41572/g.132806  ORF Transcript_41572/g.132806 Transcript_41572/m.132806 type:complete len:343 (+) Transcript_41572:408-1436(+)
MAAQNPTCLNSPGAALSFGSPPGAHPVPARATAGAGATPASSPRATSCGSVSLSMVDLATRGSLGATAPRTVLSTGGVSTGSTVSSWGAARRGTTAAWSASPTAATPILAAAAERRGAATSMLALDMRGNMAAAVKSGTEGSTARTWDSLRPGAAAAYPAKRALYWVVKALSWVASMAGMAAPSWASEHGGTASTTAPVARRGMTALIWGSERRRSTFLSWGSLRQPMRLVRSPMLLEGNSLVIWSSLMARTLSHLSPLSPMPRKGLRYAWVGASRPGRASFMVSGHLRQRPGPTEREVSVRRVLRVRAGRRTIASASMGQLRAGRSTASWGMERLGTMAPS